MPSSNLRLLAEGLILSASEVLQRIQGLVDILTAFTSTPSELYHIRDAVLTLRELLEAFYGANDISLVTLKHKRAAQGLRGEFSMIGSLFDQLHEIIHNVQEGHSSLPRKSRINEDGAFDGKEIPSKTMKTRWSSHRSELGKLLKDLRDSCSRCLGEMLLMNVYV